MGIRLQEMFPNLGMVRIRRPMVRDLEYVMFRTAKFTVGFHNSEPPELPICANLQISAQEKALIFHFHRKDNRCVIALDAWHAGAELCLGDVCQLADAGDQCGIRRRQGKNPACRGFLALEKNSVFASECGPSAQFRDFTKFGQTFPVNKRPSIHPCSDCHSEVLFLKSRGDRKS